MGHNSVYQRMSESIVESTSTGTANQQPAYVTIISPIACSIFDTVLIPSVSARVVAVTIILCPVSCPTFKLCQRVGCLGKTIRKQIRNQWQGGIVFSRKHSIKKRFSLLRPIVRSVAVVSIPFPGLSQTKARHAKDLRKNVRPKARTRFGKPLLGRPSDGNVN